MKRLIALFLAIVLLLAGSIPAYACDEKQSDIHVAEIIFGDNAVSYSNNEDAKLLLNAVYLCCEQSDNQGQDKINYLKTRKVKKLPNLSEINVKGSDLLECSHIAWSYEYSANKKARNNRKRILQNTVNKVFDFGTINNWFGSESGKCDSFAALLYYSHILSDYLADDPEDTEINLNGKAVCSYCGQPYIEINGNVPSFSASQKRETDSFINYSSLDAYGRSGVAFACISPELVASVGPRKNMVNIKPTGFNLNKDNYSGIVNSQPPYIYNRCHLIAHSLGGAEQENNLVTGTRYMNETGMEPFEIKVSKYIEQTNNHVIYRVTPVFDGDNKVVSGVQLEAYSVEDAGKGVCFNVYCYNVQPGVEINYASGDNELADVISDSENAIPFAVSNPSDVNPDLIYEMNKHLEILFEDQKSSGIYTTMMGDINSIAYEARSLGTIGEKPAQTYIKMKDCEFRCFQTLKMYVPMLLRNEIFFTSAWE